MHQVMVRVVALLVSQQVKRQACDTVWWWGQDILKLNAKDPTKDQMTNYTPTEKLQVSL